jgi:hypothetical protein
MGRRIGGRIACYLVLAMAVAGPARADQQAAPDAFRMLNDHASAIYQDTKHRFLAAADPVLMVGYDSGAFDGVLVRHQGETRYLGLTPHS